jgi:predicted ATPase/DNA-binding SARP family transcriptional activator
MAERIRILLSGRIGVEVGDEIVDGAALGPLGGLALAFLVTERSRPVTRDELAEILWGEALPPSWEASLRAVVSRVRRRLEAAGMVGDVIAGGGGCYQLHLPEGAVVDIEQAAADLEAAKEALAQGDWRSAQERAAAAAGAAGHRFLPGLGALWVERRQTALDELRVSALEILADGASAGGDHAAGLAAAEAAVAAQPLRESAHLRVMAAHAGAGNPAEALRAYERCRVVLAEELGVSPSERVQAAYEAVLAGETNTPATNLRPELSSFVGRTEARREIEKLLGTARLLTLVGPGGVGKTRLATRVAGELVPRFRDGVWLVELAALADATLLAQHVVSALAVAEKSGSTPLESLRAHLAGREALLVMDNCEHLSDACATLASDLLRAAPGLVILATSREPMGVPGETLWPVPPLSLPGPGASAWDSDAVRLFVERASAVDPEFGSSADTEAAIADICRRLDGVPLAIELAAARVRTLSVTEIADRLRDRFRLLVGRDPTAPDRHQTLRAAVDWSYEALSPTEQQLFARVSVFGGGFSLDAAAAVCSPGRDDADVFDGLTDLVDKSLVLADRSGTTTRYRLLETLRQYGAERLVASGEQAAFRDRHLAWVRSLAEEADVGLEGGDQSSWFRRLDAEEDNVRVALDWAVAHPAGDDGLRAAGALWRYWQARRRVTEGGRWLRTLLDVTTDAPPPVRAKALTSAAVLLLSVNDAALHEAGVDNVRSLLEETLAIRRAAGDRRGMAVALHGLGGLHFRLYELDAARACFEDTLAIGREIEDDRLVAASLNNLGNVALSAMNRGAPLPEGLDARFLYEESVRLLRTLGDDLATAQALGDLAAVAIHALRYADASAAFAEGAGIFRRLGIRGWFVAYTTRLAAVAQRQADYAGARSVLEDLLSAGRDLCDPSLEAQGLIELAVVWWAEGDHPEARRLYEEAAAIGRTLEVGWPLYQALNGLGVLALQRDEVSQARRLFEEAAAAAQKEEPGVDNPWTALWLAHAALADDDPGVAKDLSRKALAILSARSSRPQLPDELIDVVTVLAVREGNLERAATLVGAADAVLDRTTGPGFAPLRSIGPYQRARSAVHQGLGEAAFERAHAAGAALAPDEVLQLLEAALG